MPEYLSVAVMKQNFETAQAVHYISKRLKKQMKFIAICGNKDKRGITTQRMTISRGNAEMLIKI
jgi:tRNA pseudouridine13 synthase